MTDPQWANYYNTALAAGQSSQQAKAYADKQIQAKSAKANADKGAAYKQHWQNNKQNVQNDMANKAAQNVAVIKDKGEQYKQHWQNNKQNAQNVNPATDKLYSGMRNEQINSYNKDVQKANKDKAFVDTLHKVGDTTSDIYDAAKPYVQKGASTIWNSNLTQNYLKSVNPFQQNVPENKYLEESAREADNAAARMDANAQRNAQVANRDYKQASADEAITAGSAAAMNTTAQMSGAAGSAAAALAGQNAGNQATNNQYQTAVARNQGRSDQQNELAYDKRNQASIARSNAISARKEAQANITDKEATDKRNAWAQQLIEGDADLTRQERELDIAERQQRLQNLQDLAAQQTAAEEQQMANSQLSQQNQTQINDFINSLSDEALKAYGLQRMTGAQ